MLTDAIDGKWSEVKGRIHQRWGKFSLQEIESLEGNMDELVSKLQKVYGFAKVHAEREYHEFRVSLRTLLHPRMSR